jgi:hypothetical protein
VKFDVLQRRVQRREHVLEARLERSRAATAELKQRWHAAWTPGRIVIVGLATGFVAGHADPVRQVAKGGDLVRLVTMLSTMFATGGAAKAAGDASEAAESAEGSAAAAAETAAHGRATARSTPA